MHILEVNSLCYGYGDKTVYRNASFSLLAGEHMGVVGSKGVGKSTLLHLLTAELLPKGGEIKWQPNLNIGDLNQYAPMEAGDTIQTYLKRAFAAQYEGAAQVSSLYQKAARTGDERVLRQAVSYEELLMTQGFAAIDDEIAKVISGLGLAELPEDTALSCLNETQRRQVVLAKLLLAKADVLLLDEPTCYLEPSQINWLATYLQQFDGAFIVVSHDREFLNRITGCICEVASQTVRQPRRRQKPLSGLVGLAPSA